MTTLPPDLEKACEEKILLNSVNRPNGCIFYGNRKHRPTIRFRGKKYLISRLILMRKHGRPLSVEEFACHTCDEPRCINHEHLFIGSRSDNMKDAGRKGRTHLQNKIGSKFIQELIKKSHQVQNAKEFGALQKVTKEMYFGFIKMRKASFTHQSIAEHYGTSAPVVSYWLRGKGLRPKRWLLEYDE